MSKLTVKEYATINKLSVQSVYKRINSGKPDFIEIQGTKYIVINDSIDYEKKFNDLQLKYNSLLEILEVKNELIEQLKDKQRLFNLLLPNPDNMGKKEFKKIKPKKKKKSKKKKDKK